MTDLKTAESGQPGLYILGWPVPGHPSPVPAKEAYVIPVMGRPGGVLLAVPVDFIPQEVLAKGQTASDASELVGPSVTVEVPAIEEDEEGTEKDAGLSVAVMLVDFSTEVERGLSEFNPDHMVQRTQCFWPDAPEILPSSSSLLTQALEWTQGEVDSRAHYYSASEEVPPQEPPPRKPALKKASAPIPSTQQEPHTPKAKKVTTAVLADQVSALSQSLPAVLDQLQKMQDQQEKLERLVMTGPAEPRAPPYRQPFGSPMTQASQSEVVKFSEMIGRPPRVKATPLINSPGVVGPTSKYFPEDEPDVRPDQEGFVPMAAGLGQVQGDGMALALSQQTQAMTALVAHLVGQSDLSDLASGSASSSLTSKGSTKREKLQADLASRSSNFMLQVAQLAYRRSRPSEPLPIKLEELKGKALFTKYLTKHGGFAGHRDLGYVIWLVAHIADCLLANDVKGAQEITALTLCSLDQACQDGNKWDVAFLLALLEEPPPGVFSGRGAATNPRMRAFSPLVPQAWATTTLTFVKEMDLIATRRSEASGGAGVKKDENREQVPKKKPRYPKKPKGDKDG